MTDLVDNLALVRERIALAAQESGRSSSCVTLIAVTKTLPVDRVREAHAAGVRHFGENRVQEALSKFAPSVMMEDRDAGDEESKVSRDDITLHMIGSLQRNKARTAASFFDMVHSIDRIELAEALQEAIEANPMIREGKNEFTLPVLLEVNITGETSKSGVSPGNLPKLAEVVGGCGHLRGVGLMTVARFGAQEAELRETFARLRVLLESLKGQCPGDWQRLSMGMSDDYECAIREGATVIRLGRAIFGERHV